MCNREIKFRAWDEDTEEMIGGDELAFEEYDLLKNLLSQNVIMQFTGYKDANGVDIYDGDIVTRVDDNPIGYPDGTKKYASWFVNFRYGGWHFEPTQISPSISYPSFHSNAKYMEVIGNISESPEFMEVEK